MSDSSVPENAPHNCPGPESENAGKADACQGCPNQAICSARGPKGPDPDLPLINERMALVKHRILVLSGKGGVGKSTFASQLSLSFSRINEGNVQVGLLDLDLCGPSIPRMMGMESEQLHQSNLGWTPSYYDDNLAVMSIGFMLANPDDAVIWRGPRKNGLIKQFLKDVNWGDIDFLIIDTPPGTSDEHLSVVTYLKEAGIDGAVIITTPQDVSIVDVRKEISFCKKTGIPILGVVENMSGFVCPKCSTTTHIFKASSGGGEALAKQCEVPFLGRVPLDPRLMQACESGQSIADFAPDSPAVGALSNIVNKLIRTLVPHSNQGDGEMAD